MPPPPAYRLPLRGATQDEGRVLRDPHCGLLVDRGGRFGQLRAGGAEAGRVALAVLGQHCKICGA